jgi:hypothetical protein
LGFDRAGEASHAAGSPDARVSLQRGDPGIRRGAADDGRNMSVDVVAAADCLRVQR